MSNIQGNFTFDGANKVISCNLGTTNFSAEEVYSRWKDWCQQTPDNLKYENAFAGSVGGNPLGAGVFVGGYIFLTNGWTIKPQEADHALVISGNLFPIPDNAALFRSTTGNFQVLIGMRTSSLTQQLVTNDNSGSSASDVANAVWAQDKYTKLIPGLF